jgi:shikimate 5-dehydrogenase
MIPGTTTLIAHLGYPTEAFKAPMIYNPYFEKAGIDAVVVPMGVKSEDYRDVVKALFRLVNIRGAVVTMPHKITTVALLDEVATAVKIAGSCKAILRRPDGTLRGDMFDGAGFVRGVERKGRRLNATPLGMNEGDPLPLDVSRLDPGAFVGEVVMKQEMTPFLLPRRSGGARSRSGPTCCSSRSPPT